MKELYKFNVNVNGNTVDLVFLEPSKAVTREGEMVYAKTYAECVRSNLLTNAEAAKIANERGGVFTAEEREDYISVLGDFLVKEKAVNTAKAANEPTEELEKEVSILKDKVLYYQSKQDAVFEFTAESKARDAVLLHYALSLTFSSGKCFFDGKDYSAKLKSIDEKTDETKEAVLKKALWYATALFYGVKNFDEAKYLGDAPAVASITPDNKDNS